MAVWLFSTYDFSLTWKCWQSDSRSNHSKWANRFVFSLPPLEPPQRTSNILSPPVVFHMSRDLQSHICIHTLCFFFSVFKAHSKQEDPKKIINRMPFYISFGRYDLSGECVCVCFPLSSSIIDIDVVYFQKVIEKERNSTLAKWSIVKLTSIEALRYEGTMNAVCLCVHEKRINTPWITFCEWALNASRRLNLAFHGHR